MLQIHTKLFSASSFKLNQMFKQILIGVLVMQKVIISLYFPFFLNHLVTFNSLSLLTFLSHEKKQDFQFFPMSSDLCCFEHITGTSLYVL
jgi:hypothetical protein